MRRTLANSLCVAAIVIAGCSSSHDAAKSSACDGALALNDDECSRAMAMKLPDALPPARGNKYGDDIPTAQLGFTLFFAAGLGNGATCTTCHDPQKTFTDAKTVSVGVGTGTRNSLTVFNAARLDVIFWDGRADSLWSQPLFAIENPLEMNSSRLALAHYIHDLPGLKAPYESVFGPLPDLSTLPATGKPGDAAFDQLTADQQAAINRVAANVGKAIEAYLRKNTSGDATFDGYLGGDTNAIPAAAKSGLVTFLREGCDTCHSGPMLSDQKFHDVGFPATPGVTDDGRASAVAILSANIFNLAGPYADENFPVDTSDRTPNGFRTPPLRDVVATAPYGHDGALATLDDVLALHAPKASAEDRANLEAFLLTLTGVYPLKPWSNWPSPQ